METPARAYQADVPAIDVTPETPADGPAIQAVLEEAFGRDAEAAIVARVRQTDRFVPALSLVARVDRAVVGHALFSRVDLQGPSPARVLALGPIGVRPRWQRLGVGRALVEAGLREIRRSDEGCVAVLGDPAYYSRFGFVSSERFGIEPFWPAMMILDLGGAGRARGGTIVYPSAFSQSGESEIAS